MAKIITAAIIKGGTGKTTTAAALAQAARFRKKKVLAVDIDPQANLTAFLAGDDEHAGSYDILHGEDVKQAIQTTPQGIDLLAACPDLAAEKTSGGSAKRLEKALLPVKEKYDYIFIDAAPIGIVTDAMLLSDFTSRFLFVIRQKMSKKDVKEKFMFRLNCQLKKFTYKWPPQIKPHVV